MGTPLYVISYEIARKLGEPVGELEMVADLITGTSKHNPATAQIDLRRRARERGITHVFEVQNERTASLYVAHGKGYSQVNVVNDKRIKIPAASQNS